MQSQCPFKLAEFAEKHFDHHSPEYRSHSYEIFDYLRANCPVTRSDQHGGYWVLTRYEDIMRVAQDDETFKSSEGITIPAVRSPDGRPMTIPIDTDPPMHRPYRRLVDPLVAPKAMQGYEAFLRKLTTELVDGFIEKGEADLSRDLGSPLTSIFTMKVAGLPLEDWQLFADPIQRSIAGVGNPEEIAARYEEARQRIPKEIARQRVTPVEGGAIAALIKAEVEDPVQGRRKLEDWEITAFIWLFVVGGVDTTQALMGNMFVWLARNPERRQWLIDHPDDVGEAIEEFLRFFTPQQALARTATRDVEIGGKQIRAGDRVYIPWVAGNRDPEQFERPNEVDFNRDGNPHMAFGVGAHRCMGSNVARTEIRLALQEVLARLPDYTLVEEQTALSPDVGIVYAYKAVPIRFKAGRKALAA
ncbi:MAG: cytochrome P450 [Gammaproteobacteria bacterium]